MRITAVLLVLVTLGTTQSVVSQEPPRGVSAKHPSAEPNGKHWTHLKEHGFVRPTVSIVSTHDGVSIVQIPSGWQLRSVVPVGSMPLALSERERDYGTGGMNFSSFAVVELARQLNIATTRSANTYIVTLVPPAPGALPCTIKIEIPGAIIVWDNSEH